MTGNGITTCSDSFWFWFMRPFAETFGAIAMISSVAVLIFAGFSIIEFMAKRKKK